MAGNDIGALTVVEVTDSTSLTSILETVQQLLDEYIDVFEDPKTLPPSRFHDHQIPLLPNSIPVNSKPYKYSPLHKDEIEKQVKTLLEVGLIPALVLLLLQFCWSKRKMVLGASVLIIGS